MPAQELLSSVAASLLYAVAGSCVFLVLLNRGLMSMRDQATKVLLSVVLLVAFTAGAAVVGPLVPSPARWLLPVCP